MDCHAFPGEMLAMTCLAGDSAVIIHTLEQAIPLLKEAEAANREIVLQTPSDAIHYAGSMYLLNLFKQAQAACPNAKATFILDCGNARAEVIAAMQDGHTHIKSSANPEVRAKLKAIADEHGVNFIETYG